MYLLNWGRALGAVGRELRDAILAAFLMGYLAFVAGTVALGAWYAIAGVTSGMGILAGLVVALVFGALAGAWSAGAAASMWVIRRRPHASHIL